VTKRDRVTRVYVAGPLTTSQNQHRNVLDAIDAADKLLRAGFYPYVPHLSFYWDACHVHSYETWMDLDLRWLEKCDALVRLPGHSPGSDREVIHAQLNGIRVYHGLDEFLSAHVAT